MGSIKEMKLGLKFSFILVLSVLLLGKVNAEETHRIDMKKITDVCGDKPQLKAFSKAYCFYLDGKSEKIETILVSMKEINLKAYRMMKFSKKMQNLSTALTVAGIGLALFPIGQFLMSSEENPDWTLSGVGAGMVLLTIPISQWSLNRSTKAIELHHASLAFQTNFKLKFKGANIGLSMGF